MNTEMKHTPTPWNLHHYYDGKPIVVLRDDGTSFSSAEFYIAQGEKIIGTVAMRAGAAGWPNVENHAEAKANAELIIAAVNSYHSYHSDQAKIKALTEALAELIIDAEYMDKRLLIGQPDPGCEKGSIVRAKAALSLAKS